MSQASDASRSGPALAAVAPIDPSAASWRRLAIVGLFTLLPLLTMSRVVFGALIPPVAVFSLLFAGIAVGLLLARRRWLLYVAAALGLGLVVANTPFIIEDFVHPETFAGFSLSVAVPVVALTMAASAILATRPQPPAATRIVSASAVAIIVAGLAVSAVASLSLSDDIRQAGDIEVVAENVKFPPELRVAEGSETLFIVNKDIIRHTLLIEGTELKIEIPGSTSRRVEFDISPGEYRYYCDVVGHGSMEGVLIVE